MICYDTRGNHLGSCNAFPKEGEQHYFGDILAKFIRTESMGCEIKFIFERVPKMLTEEELKHHEELLKDYPDAMPTLQTLERYIHTIRELRKTLAR